MGSDVVSRRDLISFSSSLSLRRWAARALMRCLVGQQDVPGGGEVAGDDGGVDRIGLGGDLDRAGEVPDLGRVEDIDREAGCGEGIGGLLLVTARGLEADGGDAQAPKFGVEGGKARRAVSHREGLARGVETDIEALLRNVDANELKIC